MRTLFFLAALLATTLPAAAQMPTEFQRISSEKAFDVLYSAPDSATARALVPVFRDGVAAVEAFFGQPFRERFDVYILPDRAALDRAWQQAWADTSFHSQCWMVGSGVGRRFDLLSPRTWATEACEHRAGDTAVLRELVLHELVHVYHGQYNPTSDFTGLDALGWWIEGLATFASGQFNERRRAGVLKLLDQPDGVPVALEKFWSGPQRYGLAGSVAAYIDATAGRDKLAELLPATTAQEIFERLNTDEKSLLEAWRAWCKAGFER